MGLKLQVSVDGSNAVVGADAQLRTQPDTLPRWRLDDREHPQPEPACYVAATDVAWFHSALEYLSSAGGIFDLRRQRCSRDEPSTV